MKLVFDEVFYEGLKDYLLKQPGIIDVKISAKDFISEIKINSNDKTNPLIVLEYIEKFQYNDHSRLLSFDKGSVFEFNSLKYLIDDICCEYCYKSLIQALFKNDHIKSVQSNFDLDNPAVNVELLIEYDKNYNKEDLEKYILENK